MPPAKFPSEAVKLFDQDLSGWCVTYLSANNSTITNFSRNCPLENSNKPVWGTCPGG